MNQFPKETKLHLLNCQFLSIFFFSEMGQIHVLKRIQYQNEFDLIIKDVSDFAQIKSLTMTFKLCHTF